MKKSLLVGYFGFGNMGDEAVLQLIKRELEAVGIPYRTFFGENAVQSFRKILTLRGAIADSSALIFPCGNLLQNETSNGSLLYYLHAIRCAAAIKVPVFFASCGIGKISGRTAHQLTKFALSCVEFFGARTHLDAVAARKLGVKTVAYVPDIAFTLPEASAKKENIFAYIPKSENRPLLEKVKKLAQALSLSPIIISMQSRCDEKICASVAKSLGAQSYDVNDAESLTALLSTCRFTVSERLHGGILSLVSHTPAFLPDSSEKCSALIDDISHRSSELGILTPLYSHSELSVEKIKELGVRNSEFDILLSSLRYSVNQGLSKLLGHLRTLSPPN